MTAEQRGRLAAVSSDLEWDFDPDTGTFDEAAVVVAPTAPLSASAFPRLKWVQFSSAGMDDVIDQVRSLPGVHVTNARGVYATLIAEYVLAGLLRVRSAALHEDPWREKHRWPTAGPERDRLRNVPLRGSTAVIVGYGGIGREVARLLAAFGVQILAVKARPNRRRDDGFRLPGTGDPEGQIPSEFHAPTQLARVAPRADVLILSAPLTDATREVVNAALIEQMRPGAWIVNVARGGLIDEASLLRALDAGVLGGVILDVTAVEPLPRDHAFWDHPRVELSPHTSAGGPRGSELFLRLLEANVARFTAGRPLLNPVDVRRGY